MAPLYQMARLSRREKAGEESTSSAPNPAPHQPAQKTRLRAMFPYAFVIALLGLVVYSQVDNAEPMVLSVLLGIASAVVLLLFVRVMLSTREQDEAARQQFLRLVALHEEGKRQAETHTRELEESIQRLIEIQARVAHGDYSARVPVLEKGALFPLAAMLNLMLSRTEQRIQASRKDTYLAQIALRQAALCQDLKAGNTDAAKELLKQRARHSTR